MKTIVTKGKFAELRGVGAPAVSNWIAEGKITPKALVGEGVRAKIWFEQAEYELGLRLDPSQHVGRDQPAAPIADAGQLDLPPASTGHHVPPAAVEPVLSADDEILRRRRLAEAEAAEHDAEIKRRKLQVDAGTWVDAHAAKREFGAELAKRISADEQFLFSTLPRVLADKYGVDWKEISVITRAEYRKLRSDGAEAAAKELREHEAAMAQAAE